MSSLRVVVEYLVVLMVCHAAFIILPCRAGILRTERNLEIAPEEPTQKPDSISMTTVMPATETTTMTMEMTMEMEMEMSTLSKDSQNTTLDPMKMAEMDSVTELAATTIEPAHNATTPQPMHRNCMSDMSSANSDESSMQQRKETEAAAIDVVVMETLLDSAPAELRVYPRDNSSEEQSESKSESESESASESEEQMPEQKQEKEQELEQEQNSNEKMNSSTEMDDMPMMEQSRNDSLKMNNEPENLKLDVELLELNDDKGSDTTKDMESSMSCECRRREESENAMHEKREQTEEFGKDMESDEKENSSEESVEDRGYLMMDTNNNWDQQTTLYADINSAIHLQPIVESVEIVPARLTQPLLDSYTQQSL